MTVPLALWLWTRLFSISRLPRKRQHGQELWLASQALRRQEVGALGAGGGDGLLGAPALDGRVVARGQHLGHGDPLDDRGARVVRVVEEALAEAVALDRAGEADDP